MSAVENKMNTELNNEMNTEKKVKVVKVKKTDAKPATKPLVFEEDEKVAEVVVTSAVVDAVKSGEPLEEQQELQEDTISDAGSNNSASAEEDVDEELAEQMAIIKAAMERTKHLSMKKKLIQRSGEFLEKLKVSKYDELSIINMELEKLIKMRESVTAEVETLAGINVDEDDVMGFLSENYADFVNKLAFPEEEKIKEKTPAVEGEKKKGTRTAIDRKAYPNYLIDRMVFQASANHKEDKERGKITMEVVFNAGTKKFYNKQTKKEYEFLQDANREWCNARGYEKLGNAWEDFKALNLKTKKTRSIAMLHQQDWIADSISGAEDYVDKKFKF